MVTVVNFKKIQADEGKPFFTLEIRSEIEMVRSNATGRFYATVRTISIPTTFDETQCSTMIGRQIPGTIQRVECEPYEYVIPGTGEKIEGKHTYVYVPEG